MILATIPPQISQHQPAPIEISVSCYDDDEMYVNKTFDLLTRFSMTSLQSSLKNRISEIDNLSDNWDGYGAEAPSDKVIKNAFKFLDCILDGQYDGLDKDGIVPTPYGSIVMDFRTIRGLVSIEIGKAAIGFFTEYEDETKDISSEEIRTDFRSIPDDLKEALNLLYV